MSVTLKDIEKQFTIRKNFVQFSDNTSREDYKGRSIVLPSKSVERTVTIAKIKMFLENLYIIRDNKDLIMKNETKNRKYDRFSFIYDMFSIERSDKINLENGDKFQCSQGICLNIGMNEYQLQPFCRKIFSIWCDLYPDENAKQNILFPVGGYREYRSKYIWSNPRRWELVDFLIAAFELIISKGNKK